MCCWSCFVVLVALVVGSLREFILGWVFVGGGRCGCLLGCTGVIGWGLYLLWFICFCGLGFLSFVPNFWLVVCLYLVGFRLEHVCQVVGL